MNEDELSHIILGLAIDVHRNTGPGLLESVYEAGMAYELSKAGVPFERQVELPVKYGPVKLDCGFRLDLWVAKLVIVEIKSVDRLMPIHKAQVLTYLKLTGCKLGLLINFNTIVLREGIKRVVLGL